LEFELLRQTHFTTRAQARRAVAGYLEECNLDRRRSTCGMVSPVAYEHGHAGTAA
jgi:putative transposase